MISKRLKDKKAAIGETLTWFFAFILITAILVAFLVFVGFLSGQKTIKELKSNVFASGSSETKTNLILNDLETQRKLFYVLEMPLGDGTSVKDSITKAVISKDANLDTKVNSVIAGDFSRENLCYLLLINNALSSGQNDLMQKEEVSFTKISFTQESSEIKLELYTKKC